MVGDESGEWYELTGSTEQWPNDYNFANNGWKPSREDLSQEYAFALVMSTGDKVLEDQDHILLIEEELGLISSGIASKLLGEWFQLLYE